MRAMQPVLLGLTAAMLAGGVHADETRNYSGGTARGQSFVFDHWLTYAEASCLERGAVRIAVRTPPRLGTVSIRTRSTKSDSGACAGKPFSVVEVVYRAGRTPGDDRFTYEVQGFSRFFINAAVTVR